MIGIEATSKAICMTFGVKSARMIWIGLIDGQVLGWDRSLGKITASYKLFGPVINLALTADDHKMACSIQGNGIAVISLKHNTITILEVPFAGVIFQI